MAITAKFEADFESFKSAVAAADAALRGLEGNAAKVGPAIQKAGTDATVTLGDMKNALTSLASAFGIAFTVGAVVNFGREVIAAGSGIERMAAQTGSTNAEIQKFQYIGGQTSTTVEALVSSVQNLQQRLGDDTTGAAGALARLGIHADAFKRLSPYEQVLTLSDALRNETDVNVRASEGAALFGKTWKEISPAILANMRDIGAAAPQMSDATVKALDDADKALNRAKQSATVFGGDVVMAFEKAVASAKTFAFWAAGMHEPVAKFTVDSAMLSEGQDHLSDTIEKSARQLKEEADALKAAEEATKKKAAATQKYLDDIVAGYKAKVAIEKEAFAIESGQLAEISAAYADYNKAVNAASHDAVTAQIADAYAAAEGRIAAILKAKTYTIAAEVEIRAAAEQTAANIVQKSLEADVHSKQHFLLLADQARIAYDFATAHADSYSADWIQKLADTAAAAQRAAESWGLSFDTALDGIKAKSDSVAKSVTLSFSQAMDAVHAGLGTMTGTVQGQTLAQLRAMAAAQGGQVNWDDYNNPYIYIPGANAPGRTSPRAAGGPVDAGMPYMVGERGPELFIPSSSGSISPNGGVSVVNHIYVNGTAEDVARKVMDEITRSMKVGRKWPAA